MELSDLHHPNCKINRKLNSDLGVGVGSESCRRESESSDSILLSPEASKATEAVEFIAEHLRNEDLYIQVRKIRAVLRFLINTSVFLFFADQGRLEVRGYGDRQTPIVYVLYRNHSWYGGDPHGRTSHLRICRSRQNHRNIPRQINLGFPHRWLTNHVASMREPHKAYRFGVR